MQSTTQTLFGTSVCAGCIQTIAGTGTLGNTGDGGPAISAQIAYPLASKVVGGTMYYTDSGNYTIRTITRAGTINTIAGNGTTGYSGDGGLATTAQLSRVFDVAVAANGDVYIADTNNALIRKVTAATGIISTVVGSYALPNFSTCQLNPASGIRYCGTFIGDGGAATLGGIRYPAGIAFSPNGQYYLIGDVMNNRIRKVVLSVPAFVSQAWFFGNGMMVQ